MTKDYFLANYNHQELVEKYKKGEITLSMNRSFCTNFLAGPRAKDFFTTPQILAHKLWTYISVSAILGVVIIPLLAWFDIITISGWWGIASLIGGGILSKATQDSACDFTREQMLEREDLYSFLQGFILHTDIVPCIVGEKGQTHV